MTIFFPIFSVRSGPTAGIVTDGEIPDQDIDYTHNTATVTAHFKGFHSSICGGIQHYTWSIGTDTEGSEVENVLETTTRGLSGGRGQVSNISGTCALFNLFQGYLTLL